ncbi:MAG: efflux RND transporter periplasmic adaptor subunit [Gammaproteobacteria bacterium]|nr:efflux RND transporter periplasmic adaptor subunit [Gammaproteobacteria bacterium]
MDLGKFSKYRSWLYSAAIAILVAAWLASGKLDDADRITGAPQAADTGSEPLAHGKVRVRTLLAEDVTRTIVVNGKTAPARITELSAETDGRVVAIGAERGANVKRGAVIVRLDERDRNARLAEARATLKQREVEYEARRKLMSSSYVSEAQLQDGLARLEAARAELTRAELDLEYMLVRAPFDGAIQARSVEVGNFLKVGDPIATFVDNRRIIVAGSVSEFDAGYLRVGEPARAKLATGEEVAGTIRYVAPVAEEATRTFAVELEVDNSDGKLRAGGTAELYIPAEAIRAHRVSPSLLTLDDAGNVGIKIVNDADEVEFVVADIALSSNDGVWLAGLPESITIITVGQGFVVVGEQVAPVPEDDVPTAVARKIPAESE